MTKCWITRKLRKKNTKNYSYRLTVLRIRRLRIDQVFVIIGKRSDFRKGVKMNVYNTRQLLKEKSIFDVDLVVAYYARVSTDKEEQKTSIVNQRGYYEEYIKKNPRWTFGGAYIDEGISGISAEKRDAFQKMIMDAKSGRIDLILTKEISRFARNTLDSIHYTRDLLSYGTAVWFQNDNINTLDEDSELRLTIMAGIAQDELRKLSNRVRFGHARSIQNGVVMGNSMIYGYDKENGHLIINEEEAPMVKLIFEKYATGRWTTPMIEQLLWERGYRNRKGGKINRTVIGHIICNPKYKGFYVGGKVKIVDMFLKKQEFLPEEKWNMFKDDGTRVPQLIDEKTWELANRYFRERGSNIKNKRSSFKYGNIFTGKLICGEDGAKYWLKTHRSIENRGDDTTWVCSYRTQNGKDHCKSFPIKEVELKKVLADVFNRLTAEREQIIKEYMTLYETAVKSRPSQKEMVKKLEEEIEVLRRKQNKILEFNLAGHIADEEFISRNKEFSKSIKEKQNILTQLEKTKDQEKDEKEKLQRILKNAADYSFVHENDITKEFVNEAIDKIIVKTTGECQALLEVYLKSENSLFAIDSNASQSSIMLFQTNANQPQLFYRTACNAKEPTVYAYSAACYFDSFF